MQLSAPDVFFLYFAYEVLPCPTISWLQEVPVVRRILPSAKPEKSDKAPQASPPGEPYLGCSRATFVQALMTRHDRQSDQRHTISMVFSLPIARAITQGRAADCRLILAGVGAFNFLAILYYCKTFRALRKAPYAQFR